MIKVLLVTDAIMCTSKDTKFILQSFLNLNVQVQIFNINRDTFLDLKTVEADFAMNRLDVYSSESRVVYEILKSRGIKVLNDGFEKTNNKYLSSTLMEFAGIDTIPTYNINANNMDFMISKLNFPFVIKSTEGYSGQEVYKVLNSEQAKKILLEDNKFFIAQPFISCNGEDYRVIVVGRKIVRSIRRSSTTDDFRANLSLGGVFEDVDSKELNEKALEVMDALGLDMLGLDFIFDGEKYLFCEANNCFDTINHETAENVIKAVLELS